MTLDRGERYTWEKLSAIKANCGNKLVLDEFVIHKHTPNYQNCPSTTLKLSIKSSLMPYNHQSLPSNKYLNIPLSRRCLQLKPIPLFADYLTCDARHVQAQRDKADSPQPLLHRNNAANRQQTWGIWGYDVHSAHKVLDEMPESMDAVFKAFEKMSKPWLTVINLLSINEIALGDDIRDHFLQLAVNRSSIICCRVSPKQKALITRLVKKYTGKMTLAIGDGNAVHRHWCYKRISKMILYFVYKNIVFGLTLLYYELYSKFSWDVLHDRWYMLMFILMSVKRQRDIKTRHIL
ncbi:unnamed protein product [Lactuca saligna]|uniref:P-type ATPase C-terminal domain-containing protein n=1 Tax=Lactuca saligna TaxID=75948 RepID=A0AA35ZYP5_LACSI|nr:unnamed protein product [Lactuca saligna]